MQPRIALCTPPPHSLLLHLRPLPNFPLNFPAPKRVFTLRKNWSWGRSLLNEHLGCQRVHVYVCVWECVGQWKWAVVTKWRPGEKPESQWMKGACQVGVLGSAVCVCERTTPASPQPPHPPTQRCGLSQAYVPLRRACTDPLKALYFLFCKLSLLLKFQSWQLFDCWPPTPTPNPTPIPATLGTNGRVINWFFVLSLFNKVMCRFWTFIFFVKCGVSWRLKLPYCFTAALMLTQKPFTT